MSIKLANKKFCSFLWRSWDVIEYTFVDVVTFNMIRIKIAIILYGISYLWPLRFGIFKGGCVILQSYNCVVNLLMYHMSCFAFSFIQTLLARGYQFNFNLKENLKKEEKRIISRENDLTEHQLMKEKTHFNAIFVKLNLHESLG